MMFSLFSQQLITSFKGFLSIAEISSLELNVEVNIKISLPSCMNNIYRSNVVHNGAHSVHTIYKRFSHWSVYLNAKMHDIVFGAHYFVLL